MTRQASDILAVQLLQQVADVQHPLRVVPLFETADDSAPRARCHGACARDRCLSSLH
jgi:phosphoenolpyruvate carboxylase